MNPLAINKLRRSMHSVLSVTLTIVPILLTAPKSTAQAMQQGISVELAVTSNALPMPDADNKDASIVAVTEGGSVYLGINSITPAALAEELNGRQKLYIKADARVRYANVGKILEAASIAGVAAPILLTAQPDSSHPGTIVPPKGLEVLLVPPPGPPPTVVQVLDSGQQAPTLRVNSRQIPWPNLQNLLTQLFQNRPEKVVLVKADGVLPFADVVHVIDTCHSAGAKVVLAKPGL